MASSHPLLQPFEYWSRPAIEAQPASMTTRAAAHAAQGTLVPRYPTIVKCTRRPLSSHAAMRRYFPLSVDSRVRERICDMRPCPPRFMPCSSPGWHRMDRAHLERFVRPVAQRAASPVYASHDSQRGIEGHLHPWADPHQRRPDRDAQPGRDEDPVDDRDCARSFGRRGDRDTQDAIAAAMMSRARRQRQGSLEASAVPKGTTK